MGFWKDVQMDMSNGMSQSEAIKLNIKLRDKNIPEREKQQLLAIANASIKLNSMK